MSFLKNHRFISVFRSKIAKIGWIDFLSPGTLMFVENNFNKQKKRRRKDLVSTIMMRKIKTTNILNNLVSNIMRKYNQYLLHFCFVFYFFNCWFCTFGQIIKSYRLQSLGLGHSYANMLWSKLFHCGSVYMFRVIFNLKVSFYPTLITKQKWFFSNSKIGFTRRYSLQMSKLIHTLKKK